MNLPTKITVSRIIATVVMIVTLFILSIIPNFQSIAIPLGGEAKVDLVFLIILVFFLLASYTDHLDGKLARKNNQVTNLGKFLDPVADKLLVDSIVIFLVARQFYSYNTVQYVTFNMWCALILIVRDLVIDALRQIAAQKNIVIAANKWGKLKTVLEMIAISFVLANGWPFSYFDQGWQIHVADILVYACTIVSVISGVIYIVKNKKVFLD